LDAFPVKNVSRVARKLQDRLIGMSKIVLDEHAFKGFSKVAAAAALEIVRESKSCWSCRLAKEAHQALCTLLVQLLQKKYQNRKLTLTAFSMSPKALLIQTEEAQGIACIAHHPSHFKVGFFLALLNCFQNLKLNFKELSSLSQEGL
jgi:hypothetical protein